MAFQRAQWHSGLTYEQVCENCKNTIRYTDYNLDYRPWYADGYVDCPVCQNHLRHNENYAINDPNRPKAVVSQEAPVNDGGNNGFTEKFCTKCGNKYAPEHRFCSACGAKRN